jgi:hypothetical protein
MVLTGLRPYLCPHDQGAEVFLPWQAAFLYLPVQKTQFLCVEADRHDMVSFSHSSPAFNGIFHSLCLHRAFLFSHDKGRKQ